MQSEPIAGRLHQAIDARAGLFDLRREAAFRLYNGFLEGCPDLVVDLYASTLVLGNYAENPQDAMPLMDTAVSCLLEQLPWVQSVIVKTRSAADEQARRGVLVHGQAPDRKIRENGVWYALDLMLNLDASLYLDTRYLRAWAIEHLAGKRVLNTFAYTGSLGTAAMAGGARQVVQADLNRRFLNLAKDSYALNGFPVQRSNFRTGDFWVQASQMRRAGELFDCVFVDPPFFSKTARGIVDLVSQSQQVINKVRPLVAHNGWLVAINNALFLSGSAYLHMLQELCADGYMSVEALIAVSPDFTGFPETRVGHFPVDPAPFNHATKIAVLCVRRKDEMAAGGDRPAGGDRTAGGESML
jgi:23S rRNA (cytosine1962-C5)-methyltransferase